MVVQICFTERALTAQILKLRESGKAIFNMALKKNKQYKRCSGYKYSSGSVEYVFKLYIYIYLLLNKQAKKRA